MRIGLAVVTILIMMCLVSVAASDDKAPEVTFVMKDGSRVDCVILQYVGGHFLVKKSNGKKDDVKKLDIDAKDVEAVLFGTKEERNGRAEKLLDPEDERRDRGRPFRDSSDGFEDPDDARDPGPDYPEPGKTRDLGIKPDHDVFKSDKATEKMRPVYEKLFEDTERNVYDSDISKPFAFIWNLAVHIGAAKKIGNLKNLINEHNDRLKKADPKDAPLLFKEYSFLFAAMLDKKDYSDIIWKQIKPKHETPFKIEM